MNENLSPAELSAIIEKENYRSKLLVHDICSWESGKDNLGEIHSLLSSGQEVTFKPEQYTFEFALSLWPQHKGRGGYLLDFWGRRPDANQQGILVFEDSFYDKICSQGIPDETLLRAWQNLRVVYDGTRSDLTRGDFVFVYASGLPKEEVVRRVSQDIKAVSGVPLDAYLKARDERMMREQNRILPDGGLPGRD